MVVKASLLQKHQNLFKERKSMNRAELIEAMASETNTTKTACEEWLNAFISTVEKNIKKNDGVRLVGFGTFTVSKRKSRMGRNPQTGETIKIPARTVPVFRPGNQLKARVSK